MARVLDQVSLASVEKTPERAMHKSVVPQDLCGDESRETRERSSSRGRQCQEKGPGSRAPKVSFEGKVDDPRHCLQSTTRTGLAT